MYSIHLKKTCWGRKRFFDAAEKCIDAEETCWHFDAKRRWRGKWSVNFVVGAIDVLTLMLWNNIDIWPAPCLLLNNQYTNLLFSFNKFYFSSRFHLQQTKYINGTWIVFSLFRHVSNFAHIQLIYWSQGKYLLLNIVKRPQYWRGESGSGMRWPDTAGQRVGMFVALLSIRIRSNLSGSNPPENFGSGFARIQIVLADSDPSEKLEFVRITVEVFCRIIIPR